jgi:hypothetical protein
MYVFGGMLAGPVAGAPYVFGGMLAGPVAGGYAAGATLAGFVAKREFGGMLAGEYEGGARLVGPFAIDCGARLVGPL